MMEKMTMHNCVFSVRLNLRITWHRLLFMLQTVILHQQHILTLTQLLHQLVDNKTLLTNLLSHLRSAFQFEVKCDNGSMTMM